MRPENIQKCKRIISEACRKLKLSKKVEKRALALSTYLYDTGHWPKAVAAGAIYLAALIEGERRTQLYVALATGTNEVALRANYKMIFERLVMKQKDPRVLARKGKLWTWKAVGP